MSVAILPITSAGAIKLTSTTSSQSTAIPSNVNVVSFYNAAANAVYLAFNATVSVPAALTAGVMVVPPASERSFSVPPTATTLNYIADTAGGVAVASFGAI